MRELTFRGFLQQYVQELSGSKTTSLYKLANEATTNLRLREPLMLYAMYSNKTSVLLQATKDEALKAIYSRFAQTHTCEQLNDAFNSEVTTLDNEYRKVWRSYQARKHRCVTDDHTKELMRQKIKRLQPTRNVSNYQMYTQLHLNPGNINAWLKHGDGTKVSLDTARNILHFVEAMPPRQST